MSFAIVKYAVVAIIASMSGPHAVAAITLVPPDLAPGAQYRLAFVTSGTRDATSSNIADYNTFVTSQANLNVELAPLGTTWKVIGSTESVDARVNTGTDSMSAGAPVFRLDGVRIANNNADLWDGVLLQTLSVDQFGEMSGAASVFTGTNFFGESASGCEMGNTQLIFVRFGSTAYTDYWVDSGGGNRNPTIPLSMYAISSVLIVPVREPSSALLIGIGACGWSFARRRRTQNS